MGVASRKPRAAPAFEAAKRAVSDLYQLPHVDRLEAAASALAAQWYVSTGTLPPGWLSPPGLDEALRRAEAELARSGAAAGGDAGS